MNIGFALQEKSAAEVLEGVQTRAFGAGKKKKVRSFPDVPSPRPELQSWSQNRAGGLTSAQNRRSDMMG